MKPSQSTHPSGMSPVERLATCCAAIAILAAGAVLAQSSSATYSVPRQSIDGGAQRAASATYTLNGTVGQPDAGPAMSGATFSVRGGFQRATASGPQPDPIFANGFEP